MTMTTTYTATDFVITDADFRSGRLTILDPDGKTWHVTLHELASAAHGDPACRGFYRALHTRAIREIEAARKASISRCRRHTAAASQDRPYDGTTRDDNRAADGNITRVQSCACGAERRQNINGHHVAADRWS